MCCIDCGHTPCAVSRFAICRMEHISQSILLNVILFVVEQRSRMDVHDATRSSRNEQALCIAQHLAVLVDLGLTTRTGLVMYLLSCLL